MKRETKFLKICKKGHRYYKSSDCLACPQCEKEDRPAEGFLSLISAPARRALQNAGIHTLKSLSTHSESEIAGLHGMGASGLSKLRLLLRQQDLSFKK